MSELAERAERFEKFLRDEFSEESGWEYGDGEPMTPDCNAFLSEIARLRAELAASQAEVARLRAIDFRAIIEQHVYATDEWGGSKLAGWQYGGKVVVGGIDEANDAIKSALAVDTGPALVCGHSVDSSQSTADGDVICSECLEKLTL